MTGSPPPKANGSHDDDLTVEKVCDHIRKTRPNLPSPPVPDEDLLESDEVTPDKVKEALRAASDAAQENAAQSSKVAEAAKRPGSGAFRITGKFKK